MTDPTYWPAPAKLNLFLYINGRQPNGYHELQTLFQFLDHGDTLLLRLIKAARSASARRLMRQ